MRFSIITAFMLLALLPVSVCALENNMYFSVDPSQEYSCVYVNLPQDLGLVSVDKNMESVIEAEKEESQWIDTTYNKIMVNPGVLNKNPVCFYYPGKSEGDFSFYKVKVYSNDIGVSNEMSGGLCISEYEDIDSGPNATKTTNICKLINDNADLFDLQFKHETSFANPGETVTKTIYLTSYASLNTDLTSITTLQNDFGSQTVSTSPQRPLVTKSFKVKVPNKEGEYSLIVLAKVRGCSLTLCEKELESKIKVASDFLNEGFATTIVPKNINLKDSQETIYRLFITNYEESNEFTIETSSDPPINIDPKSISTSVNQEEEKTITFKVTPTSSDPSIYRLYFKVKTSETEKMVNAYLTVGELLTDALRESEDLEDQTTDPDIRNQINLARNTFLSQYNSSSYGNELDDYEDFKEELENARAGLGGNEEEPQQPDTINGGIDWIWIAVPVVIIAVVLVFFFYKKTKVVSEYEYPRFE
jgi:hypothetical protein